MAKGITYAETVEEALCFGWIDTTIRRLDDQRYARKFCPRVNTGHWSAINLERVRRLKREGLMTAAGLATCGWRSQETQRPARTSSALRHRTGATT